MKSHTVKGYLNAIWAAVSYGTNPLFALPLYSQGLGVNSVLFYRYFFAVIIYGLWLKLHKKISLDISLKELFVLFIFGVVFSFSSLFLFNSFKYIDSGLACTILFSYPLMVALISRIFYGEKITKIVWLALLTTMVGIFLLYGGKPGAALNTKGIGFVLLSALSYAMYMVGVKRIKTVKHIRPDKMSFYVMLFGLSIYIWNLHFCTALQPIKTPFALACALMLAIFPTIISLETVTYAIKFIGATKSAIIGALEPLTAIFFGVLLFGETLTTKIIVGIVLILSGVIFVVSSKK